VGKAERAKGQRAERAVAAFLRDHGWDAVTTRAASGYQHGDDIDTNAPVSIEVKDVAKMDLSGWLRQAQSNANGKPALVWHKRRGVANPGDWYVTMTGNDLIELMRINQKG
jgi:Holliday junction resolvase